MVISLRYASNTRDFNTFFVKGILAPDEIRFFIPVDRELPDGTLHQVVVGFWRVITIGFMVGLSKSDQSYLMEFYCSNSKSLVYGTETLDVVNESMDEFSDQFLNGSDLTRYFEMRFRSKNLETIVPTSWSPVVGLVNIDGTPLVGLADDLIHGNPLYAHH